MLLLGRNPSLLKARRDPVITYAERACFRDLHLCLLARVTTYVDRVSSTWGNELRCHELARAVLRVAHSDAAHGLIVGYAQELDVVDGHCGPIEHSWLRFTDGVILDAYAPGRIPAVQIIDPIVGAAYRQGTARTDIRVAILDRLVLEMRADVADGV